MTKQKMIILDALAAFKARTMRAHHETMLDMWRDRVTPRWPTDVPPPVIPDDLAQLTDEAVEGIYLEVYDWIVSYGSDMTSEDWEALDEFTGWEAGFDDAVRLVGCPIY